MASCTKCGANLIAQARFCASCGGPVASSSIAPAPAAARPASRAVPDAFARTILSDSPLPDLPAAPAASAPPPAPAVSPMAASVMASQSQAPPPQNPAPALQPSHPFPPGSLVLVYWADGNRYPGTVLQIAQHHVFVAFPNGTQQWVDARYVQPGR